MASIVDPLGRRSAQQRSLQPLSSHPPTVHQWHSTPRSRDIFDAAHALEAGQPRSTPPSVLRRLVQTLVGSKKKQHDLVTPIRKASAANVALHLTRDYEPQNNPVHRRLPEEHMRTWQEVESQRKANSRDCQSPSILRGPVPNSKNPRNSPPNQHGPGSLSRGIDEAFLTEMEEEFYSILRRVGRCAYYRPILTSESGTSHQEVLLVHRSAVEPLHKIQATGRNMTEAEKCAMLKALDGLLISHLMYTLRQILFRPDLHITASWASSRDVQVEEKPESIRVSKSEEFFDSSKWRRPEEHKTDSNFDRGDRLSEPSLHVSHFSQRQFNPGAQTSGSDSSSRSSSGLRLRLRGGGDDDNGEKNKIFPFLPALDLRKSGKANAKLALGTPSPRLQNEERVPKALWWLAGGRTRYGKKVPTAGELRGRRMNELENRKEVGFVGTLFNYRKSSNSNANGLDGTAESAALAHPDQLEARPDAGSVKSQPKSVGSNKSEDVTSPNGMSPSENSRSAKAGSVKEGSIKSGSQKAPSVAASSAKGLGARTSSVVVSSKKAPSEKAPSEKAPSEKAPSEKAPSEKASSSNASSIEKAPSKRPSSARAPSAKTLSAKSSSAKSADGTPAGVAGTAVKTASVKAPSNKSASTKSHSAKQRGWSKAKGTMSADERSSSKSETSERSEVDEAAAKSIAVEVEKWIEGVEEGGKADAK